MSNDIAIRVENLHKEFVLNHSGAASLKTALLWWKRGGTERLHVLKGVSFEIRRGECVGILGRNGAGKSTLLALLARIYRPSQGSVEINGRLTPLLELGAGFHPDLTGLDNIFFNGIVLGLTRKQVEERIDEIIAFSELQGHIDTPVRTYSSGMAARLGFSIAAHLEPEILLIDEVLGVGDFEFVKKCKKKIEEFRASGGTILFVSHSSQDVADIADRCIWLQGGEVYREGPPGEIIEDYLAHSTSDLLRAPTEP